MCKQVRVNVASTTRAIMQSCGEKQIAYTTFVYTYVYITDMIVYIYIYICAFVCLCIAAKVLCIVYGTTRLCLCIRHAYATEKFINKISNFRICLAATNFLAQTDEYMYFCSYDLFAFVFGVFFSFYLG